VSEQLHRPALLASLDDLARDPTRAATLPSHAVRALFGQVILVQAALLPQLMRQDDGGPAAAEPTEDWISLEVAADMLGRPRSWILRRRPRPAWLKRLGRKTFVVNRRGLERWLESRPA
jgi:hypothetical protein